jgi:hypothetical protein
MKREKVTLYFKNGGAMTFKCKSFTITRSITAGEMYSHANWEGVEGAVSFNINEVIAVRIKKVLF